MVGLKILADELGCNIKEILAMPIAERELLEKDLEEKIKEIKEKR